MNDYSLIIKTDNKKYFNSLSRNESFKEYFFNEINEYLHSLQNYHWSCNDKINRLNLDELTKLNFKSIFNMNIGNIRQLLIKFEKGYFQLDTLDITEIVNNITNINNLSLDLEKIITSLEDRLEKENNELINNLYYSNIRFRNSLTSFKTFLESKEINLINNPFIIFNGEAGIGKSFLFAQTLDTARNLRFF